MIILEKINDSFFKKMVILFIAVVVVIGVFFRFYRITQNQFIYYDEGMWLNANRHFVDLVQMNPPRGIAQFFKILQISAMLSLSTAKSLWAFITSLRVFFVGADAWYFVRLVSAVFGTLTLLVTYLFARKFYDSRWIGLLSLAFLAVFPSHVYYSRSGLQEAFSTFCFMLGLYLYLFNKKSLMKIILASVVFSLVYFSNYRMIIIPFILAFSELYLAFVNKHKPDYKRFFLSSIIFFVLVLGIGSINVGKYTNLYITFAWMFRQGHIAKGHFDLMNLLSYPYYLFSLESIFFGIAFFANIYFIFKKEYYKAFPFLLVVFLMAPFSVFLEKGVRYLCAVMPFMAIASAAMVFYAYKNVTTRKQKLLVVAFVALMNVSHIINCTKIINFSSAYESSIQDIIGHDPLAKIVSTQSMVQRLYVKDQKNVAELQSNLFDLAEKYKKGYRYLIIDPQAYVYLEANDKRFGMELPNFLQYIIKYVPPLRRYSHFNDDLLKRFVLEHNENLRTSLSFLASNKNGELGALRVYDLKTVFLYLEKVANKNEK